MVAALESGEIDAAQDVPANAFERLSGIEGIVTIEGQQGNVDEVAVNGGAGLKKPHPALLDLKVRQAIAHAIDDQTIIDKVNAGIGEPALTFSPSPDPTWLADIPVEEQYDVRPRQGEPDPRRRRLRRTRTATACARCPAAASL